MKNSTYEIRLTIHDNRPGRARAEARAELMALVGLVGAAGQDGPSPLMARLEREGYALAHRAEVAEVIA